MSTKSEFTRRDFLKIVGASAGVAVTGCGQDLPEKIIPYVIQPEEVIPGIASWYAGNCEACEAGCGVVVKTREGRAIKIEGNKSHPINRGGLCAIGQSSIQAHYDPDRVREPLQRVEGGGFKAITWEQAIGVVATALSDNSSKENVFLTNHTSGSLEALISEFVTKNTSIKHLTYSFASTDLIDQAAEKVFGEGYRTQFDFSSAKTIVSFGADYLETWISPVEFSKDWSKGRKPKKGEKGSYSVHFEPRLSLTAANADLWIKNAAGREASILLALLKVLRDRGAVKFEAERIERLVRDVRPTSLLSGSGVTEKQLAELAGRLQSGPSLVVAGGAAVSGENALEAAMLTNLINLALGNVGKTVQLVQVYKPASSSFSNINYLIEAAAQKKLGVLLISGINPAFTLPDSLGFKKALAPVPLIVSVSSHLDETTQLADLVLPLSSSFESWSDSNVRPGVYSLNQPSMQPLYKTQSLGDTLLAIAAKLDIKFAEVASFYDYIRGQWKARMGAADFEKRWLGYVEKGGEWSTIPNNIPPLGLAATALDINPNKLVDSKLTGLSLLAFPSINSRDGSSANRPWMQELPNPITTAVWGSWAEIHPDTAKELGFSHGQVAQLRTAQGAIEVPLYLTRHVHPEVIAVPIGQGHSAYGRYAMGVGANPLSILDAGKSEVSISQLTSGVSLRPSRATEALVVTQMQDSQEKRGFVRQIKEKDLLSHKKHNAHSEGGHHDPHALGPRPAPKQMYTQMEHPEYRWGMSIDLNSCTGCSACVVACYAENNVPVVGKEFCAQGREMSWLMINRYMKDEDKNNPVENPVEGFIPMLCQHCSNAPCEPVCPVYATYHNEEGLNTMVYNRCVGTRYCGNNCSYKVRRFNWFAYTYPEPLNWQLNPDITVREVGIMEKCTFCVQRIREGKNNAQNEGRPVRDGEIQPACASSCPTEAITFGNLLDQESQVYRNSQDARAYKVLDFELNTQPAISYLARVDKN